MNDTKLSNILLPIALVALIFFSIGFVFQIPYFNSAILALFAFLFLFVGAIVKLFERLKPQPNIGLTNTKSDKIGNISLFIGFVLVLVFLFILYMVLAHVH